MLRRKCRTMRKTAMGQRRHFDRGPATSGPPRSADIANPVRQVRKVPGAEVAVVRQTIGQLYSRPQVD